MGMCLSEKRAKSALDCINGVRGRCSESFGKRVYSKMAKNKSQSEHDSIVKSVAEFLSKNGYRNIRAAVDGYEKPDKISLSHLRGSHVPDVTTEKNGKHYLFEVETDDSIHDERTKDKWELFSAYAKEQKGFFIISVPPGSGNKARTRLAHLGLRAYDVLEAN